MYDGKVYVVKIKPSMVKNWDNPDVVYALGYEGGCNLSFTGFRELSQDRNKKWFLSKKANSTDDGFCAWEDIVATMRMFGPTGTPQVTLTESVMTWLELATMLKSLSRIILVVMSLIKWLAPTLTLLLWLKMQGLRLRS